MEMMTYTVGNVYPEFKSGNDVAKVDMDDSGLVAYIGFSRPTAKEKQNFNPRELLQVRLTQIEDITFLL